MPLITQKISIAGNIVELYLFEKPIAYGYCKPGAYRGPRQEAKDRDRFDPAPMSPVWRARAKLQRLCTSNAWMWPGLLDGKPCLPIFITFTFADNVNDTKEAHEKFTLGMMRFNHNWSAYVPGGLKYVAVPERQKRGALHYHVLVFNLPKIPRIYDEVRDIWGHGFAIVKAVRHPRGLSRYLTKYLCKDFKSGREFNGKRYFASRGLHQPMILRNPKNIDIVLLNLPPECVPWVSERENEWLGKIQYYRFELPVGSKVFESLSKHALESANVADAHERTPDTKESVRPSPLTINL